MNEWQVVRCYEHRSSTFFYLDKNIDGVDCISALGFLQILMTRTVVEGKFTARLKVVKRGTQRLLTVDEPGV
jgi:hypothetical protein